MLISSLIKLSKTPKFIKIIDLWHNKTLSTDSF